jgi:hypothetical protein
VLRTLRNTRNVSLARCYTRLAMAWSDCLRVAAATGNDVLQLLPKRSSSWQDCKVAVV